MEKSLSVICPDPESLSRLRSQLIDVVAVRVCMRVCVCVCQVRRAGVRGAQEQVQVQESIYAASGRRRFRR